MVGGAAMLPRHELEELRGRLSKEPDPVKKRKMLDRVVLYIQFRCGELLEIITEEEDPERMLLLLADLTGILEYRRAMASKRCGITQPGPRKASYR